MHCCDRQGVPLRQKPCIRDTENCNTTRIIQTMPLPAFFNDSCTFRILNTIKGKTVKMISVLKLHEQVSQVYAANSDF